MLPSTIVGWYVLVLMFFGLSAYIRARYRVATCRRIHTALHNECRTFCIETCKCYAEFLLASSIALGACHFYGKHHSHYFMGQNLDFRHWQTHAFLISGVVMCLAPFYALMWGFISVLCPEGQDKDRHLLKFTGFVCRIIRLRVLVRNCKNFLDLFTHRNSPWFNN